MKAQRGTGLQAPLGRAPAHPNTGVNKLQMGQSVVYVLKQFKEGTTKTKRIILRRGNYMEYKLQGP